jgi:hypothetical protein
LKRWKGSKEHLAAAASTLGARRKQAHAEAVLISVGSISRISTENSHIPSSNNRKAGPVYASVAANGRKQPSHRSSAF